MKQDIAIAESSPSQDALAVRLRWPLGLFAVVFVLASATIWNVLQNPDQVLAFNDGNIEGQLAPAAGFPNALFRGWDNQSFFGSGGGQYPLTFTAIGECLGAEFYRRWGQPWIIALCALGIYWAFRQYRIGRFASALSAAIMVCSGWPFNSAITGLAVRMMALTCSAVALGFVERGRLTGQWLPYIIGGGFLGLAVAEVPDVGLLFAFSTAVVFWWTHMSEVRGQKSEISKEGVKPTENTASRDSRSGGWGLMSVVLKFALYVVFSILISWQTVSGTFSTQVQGVTQGTSESPEQRYNWATQWSLPPAELWNTVSGSYFGTSMNSPTKPYWGRNGRDPQWEETHQGMRNFVLTGWHIGVIPCTLAIVLMIMAFRRRSTMPPSSGSGTHSRTFLWLITGGILGSMMLMWGRFFFVYKLFWSLPYMGTFRCADKWNGPFLLFVGLGTAVMLDAVWKSLTIKDTKTASLWRILTFTFSGMAILALMITLGTANYRDTFVNARIEEGYQTMATVMWDNAVSASLKVFLIAGLCAAGAWWVSRRQTKGTRTFRVAVLAVISVIALGDLMADNLPYVQGHTYKHFLQPNPLTDFLDAHKTEGRIKLLPAQHPLLNNLRLTLLQIKGYDLFDPVSVSRMPTDYAALFKALEADPIRLWELGSMRFFLALPGSVDQLNKLDGNRGRFSERLALGIGVVDGSYIPVPSAPANQRYLRLVEFTGALPKYRLIGHVIAVPDTSEGSGSALQHLSDLHFDLATTAILHGTTPPPHIATPAQSSITVVEETPTDVRLKVATDQPCVLARATKYNPDWKAILDGHATPLFRANYLLQAVYVPAGVHDLTLSYRPSLDELKKATTTRALLLVILALSIIATKTIKERIL